MTGKKRLGTRRDAEKSLQARGASFDKLRMRENFGGTKKSPHPELVEGRTSPIPASAFVTFTGVTTVGELAIVTHFAEHRGCEPRSS
jgi:hypothetical protein